MTKSLPINLTLAVLALLCAMLSLGLGPAHLGWSRAFAALIGQADPIATTIVWQLRLPRSLLALMIGAMLGGAGAALQGYLRNPLADPGVLGTSSTAALGAVFALYYGFAAISPLTLPLFAIVGALVGLIPLLLLAARSEGPLALILAGVAMGSTFAALRMSQLGHGFLTNVAASTMPLICSPSCFATRTATGPENDSPSKKTFRLPIALRTSSVYPAYPNVGSGG